VKDHDSFFCLESAQKRRNLDEIFQPPINKMPVLMQKSMQEIQGMISESIPQMQKIENNFAAEMKSASN